MMQLIAMNDPAVIDINKKMSSLGEALETNNLTLDTEKCSNNVSKNENTSRCANDNVKNETMNGINQASLNINAILKINGPEIDARKENDQAVEENKIEPNGPTNGYSVPNVDCRSSADDMNTSEKNLGEKKDVILTNNIKVAEPDQTRNIEDEVSSEIPALEKTMKTDENTPTNIDILGGDNVTASKSSAFSPNSDTDEKEINISSQLQQLENDASIEEEVTPNTFITKEINKEIVQETTSGDISLNQIEENKADSLLQKGANDEVVTNKTEQIVLPCRDSSINNAKNNGISEVSTENESIVDEVSDDTPVISDNISHNVDHVIIDKPSVVVVCNQASNLPFEELSKKETMDIDGEQIDPSSRDVLEPDTQTNGISEVTRENESMVDEIFDDAVISDDISQKVEDVIIDKPSVEEESNLPLEELSKETNHQETMDIDDGQIDPPSRDGLKPDTENNRISEISSEKESIVDEVLDDAHGIIDKPSVEEASNLKKETMDIDGEQIDPSSRDVLEPDTQTNGISEVISENESMVDEFFDDAVISDDISHKVEDVIIDKPSVEEASNLPLEEISKETNQQETMDIDDGQIDPPSRDGLKPDTENNRTSEISSEKESIVDEVLDDAHGIIDKPSVEEASNLPLKELSKETNQQETMNIDDGQIDPPSRDGLKPDTENKSISEISLKKESIVGVVLDDAPIIIEKPSIEEASNVLFEEILTETNQKETMDIYDEQIDPPSQNVLKPQSIGISEETSENEFILDKKNYEVCKISDSTKDDQDIIDKLNLEEASNIPLRGLPFDDSSQKQTKDINAAKETNNDKILDENDQMLTSQLKDVNDTAVCALEKQTKAVEIISDKHDSTKNDNEDKNSTEKKPAILSKETTEADSVTPSKNICLNQNDNVVMNIDDAKEMSSEESASPTAFVTNEINVETKTDDALSVNSDDVEVKQKVNFDMDIDDFEEFPTVVSTLDSDVVIKNNKTETKSIEEVPTEQDPVVCHKSDKIETNVKKRNLMISGVKDNESSVVISIDESENNASQDKPVISICSVSPEETKEKPSPIIPEKKLPMVCKLSNTMDILSDDEDEPSEKSINTNDIVNEEPKKGDEENKCINLDDDDDIMFIEDTNSQTQNLEHNEAQLKLAVDNANDKTNMDIEKNSTEKSEEEVPDIIEAGKPATDVAVSQPKEDETIPAVTSQEPKPIISKTFLQSVTKNLAEMTRNELEDFCILKLVESVVDKTNLNEIKSKMKLMTQALEDLRKKSVALTKQNRDLQVVVKTVQEDQKKRNTNSMMPMKITRSVGMQVVLTGEKSLQKRKPVIATQPPPPTTPAKPARTSQSPKIQTKPQANIPVPRLVPAISPTLKPPATTVTNAKVTIRNVTPQRPEKRPHSKITSPAASSETVDLTDDEPPPKITTKNPTPPVRLVPSQNLMPKNRPQFTPNTSNNSARESPRKVYIPISSNNPKTPVGKNFSITPRSRPPVIRPVLKLQTVRVTQVSNRHPAPLPDAMKQFQPPGWKLLPPAPDLKLSKVDNGIVISWKFDGYDTDSYEQVASFQLYAYQETPSPPSTTLWKKIGDIKALPLPMACTLTQFMSGFKYYFAVRAIDIRSRMGPFSLPGSIMLISKS